MNFKPGCEITILFNCRYLETEIAFHNATRAVAGHDSDQSRRGRLNILASVDSRAFQDDGLLVAVMAATYIKANTPTW
jgi:hypothetical protein